MAYRADKRDIRPIQPIRRGAGLNPGHYFLVHSDQLYSLEPVDEAMTYSQSPEPLGPMGPMEAEVCGLEAVSQPGYGPGLTKKAGAAPTGFFLDRYVY
jgi:hypothetical protein